MAVGTTRATMAEQAYRSLKARIVSGDLHAGERLLPNVLATALEISPTPVKEALLRLQRDGLVETETRRGMMVRRFRRSEIIHLYEVRGLIERHALHAGFADADGLATLVKAMEREQRALLAALDRRTLAGLTEALAHDRALHAHLVAQTGNPLMADWHSQVMTQTHTIRIYTALTYTPELLIAEHGAIIAALRAKHLPEAEAALIRHLDRSREDLAERAPDRAEPEPAA